MVEMQLAVLVTASNEGEALGRDLIGRGVSLVGSTGCLGQLRRSLVRGRIAWPVVLCVTLDPPTLRRHGAAVAQILNDRGSFATTVHAIGLMLETSPADGWQSLGCDAVADGRANIAELLAAFDEPGAPAGRVSFDALDRMFGQRSRSPSRCAETRIADLRRPRR